MRTNLNLMELWLQLKRLAGVGTVLHVGAHPDDEDVGFMTYIVRKLGGRAVYWSATRGEGGQNKINEYTGHALGVFRSWESLESSVIDGVERLFGPFIDFGFSKNAEEAFAKWGRENVIREVARAIRLVRPQVVVTRWTGTPGDLHGQHQAVGEATPEAFDAASDPNRFPELIEQGLLPWRPFKLYRSTENTEGGLCGGEFGNTVGNYNPKFEREGVLRINTGEIDSLEGCTYQELAWIAFNSYKSQGVGLLPAPGDFFYYFVLLKSAVPVPAKETDIFFGFDSSLTGLADMVGNAEKEIRAELEEVKDLVAEALEHFSPMDQLPSAWLIIKGLHLLRSVRGRLEDVSGNSHAASAVLAFLDQKIREVEDAIAACMRLQIEAGCSRGKVTPGESVWVSVRLWNHRKVALEDISFKLLVPKGWKAETAQEVIGEKDTGTFRAVYEVFVPADAQLSCPYWLETPPGRYAYHWPAKPFCQKAFGPSPMEVQCHFVINGSSITLRRPVLRRQVFPGGFRELPLLVVPPISLHPNISDVFLLTPDSNKPLKLQITARCNDDERPAEGRLELSAPKEWKVSPQGRDVHLAQGGGAEMYRFTVTPPRSIAEGHYTLQYTIRCRNREYGEILTAVRMDAPGLPVSGDAATCVREEVLLSPSRVTVNVIDAIMLKERRYAYIDGVKEDLRSTLNLTGLNFHQLSDREIAHDDLSAFDVIVVGPNAYLLRDAVRENAHRLLEYANNGGTLIVQFQYYLYQQKGFAPYPIKFNKPNDRVTHEDAPVRILQPNHPLFKFPNRIGQSDFDGWIQDRGLFFVKSWDDKYTPLLSCNDPGEDPKDGGLLYCRYGAGHYIYAGYSLFRQVPAGVPGAFRLLFNMLATGSEGFHS